MSLTQWLPSCSGLLLLLLPDRVDAAETKMIPVIERNGREYVNAASLATKIGVAVKNLPGQDLVVACHRDRCVPLKDAFRETDGTLVAVAALAGALGATAEFDSARQHVGFRFGPGDPAPTDTAPRVGQLMPDFRIARLDGSPVALSDFRGKRVLINSWASW